MNGKAALGLVAGLYAALGDIWESAAAAPPAHPSADTGLARQPFVPLRCGANGRAAQRRREEPTAGRSVQVGLVVPLGPAVEVGRESRAFVRWDAQGGPGRR